MSANSAEYAKMFEKIANEGDGVMAKCACSPCVCVCFCRGAITENEDCIQW